MGSKYQGVGHSASVAMRAPRFHLLPVWICADPTLVCVGGVKQAFA
jgi:hypothetical protein